MYKFATTTNNFFSHRASRAFLLASALVFSGADLPAAQAQIFSDDIAREQAVKNADQLKDIARIMENIRGQLGEVTRKQQSLDNNLREIRGQMEEIAAANANRPARNEMKTLESSLSKNTAKVDNLSEDVAAVRKQLAEISQFITLPPEKEFYESAFADYRREEYAAALTGFEKILRYYPDGQFNANARYWMSQSFLALGEYEPAAAAARQLIALHGDGDKVPDAMLTLAQALQNLGQEAESRATLEQLLAAHPTTLAADRAREILAP